MTTYTAKLNGQTYKPGEAIEGDAPTFVPGIETDLTIGWESENYDNGASPTRTGNIYAARPLPAGEHTVRWTAPHTTEQVQIKYVYRQKATSPAKQVTQTAFKAFHARATGITAAQVCHWDVDGEIRGGFNAAIADPAGIVVEMRCLNTNDSYEISFDDTKLTVVQPGVDLAPLLVNGARIRLLDGDYTLGREVNVKDCIVVGAERSYIKWTGSDFWPGTTSPKSLIICKDSAFWWLTFDSGRRYDKSQPTVEKERRPILFDVGDDCTFYNVEAIDFNRMFHMVTKPKRVLVDSCSCNKDTRTYFAWFEGTDLVFYDNDATNSVFENMVRGGPSSASDTYGWSYVAFDNNRFGNQDNRATDPSDYKEGTLVVQAGEFMYRRNNVLKGPTGVGPLAVGDGGYANQFTDHCVVENDSLTQPLIVWPGLRDSIIIGCPIAVQTPRALSGPKTDPRKVQNMKLVGVAAPQPQPWIEGVEVAQQ